MVAVSYKSRNAGKTQHKYKYSTLMNGLIFFFQAAAQLV